jgi:hypothetical protein
MSLSDRIKKEIVQPALKEVPFCVTGKIKKYNKKSNTASIRFLNPYTREVETYHNLMVPIGSSSISFAGPFKDDEVLVGFTGVDCQGPRIISVINSFFALNQREIKQKHIDQGTYLPDTLLVGDEEVDINSNQTFDIFDAYSSNEKTIRKLIDPDEEFKYMDSNLPYFDTSELGMTHPMNKSTIKIKDDGNIDIFTYVDNGIRINSLLKRIIATTDIMKTLCYKLYEIICEGSIKFRSLKNVEINSKNNTIIDCKNLLINGTKLEDIITNISTEVTHDIVDPIEKQINNEMKDLNHEIKNNYKDLDRRIDRLKKKK